MKTEQKKGYILDLTAGALWGTIGFFATLLSNLGMNAAPVAFYRVLSSAMMLALILLIKGKGVSLFRISKRGLISCMLIGFVSQAFYNVCYMNAIEQNGMATAAVFLYTSPIYVALLSRLFFHEPLSGNKILAILVNIIGCVLTVTGGAFSEQRISAFGLMMGFWRDSPMRCFRSCPEPAQMTKIPTQRHFTVSCLERSYFSFWSVPGRTLEQHSAGKLCLC